MVYNRAMAAKRKSQRAGGAPAGGAKFGRRGRRLFIALAVVLALAGTLYLLRRPILAGAGHLLVASDRLEKADAALVLGGEDSYDAERTRAAVKLYRDGWVRKLVLSGPAWPYGLYESDLSLPVAIAAGVPRADILPIRHQAKSTEEELGVVIPQLEQNGFRWVYVVTSNYHTGRARRIFRKIARGRLRVLAYPAADQWFNPDAWWQTREGRKVFLMESLKSFHSLLE